MHYFVLNLNHPLYVFHNLSINSQSSDRLETFRETGGRETRDGSQGDWGRFSGSGDGSLFPPKNAVFRPLCSTKNRQPLSK